MNPHFLFFTRLTFLTLFLFVIGDAMAQIQPIASAVYRWDGVSVVKKAGSEQRVLLEGATPAFAQLKVYATTILPGQSQTPHPGHTYADEELIIVKEGELTVTIDEKTETLEVGSVAFIMPEPHSFANLSDKPVTYYVMRYHTLGSETKSKLLVGQSFVKHWKELEYKPNDKGGRRNVFDQKTTESERFEMHITTLNEGLMSHPPHTHKAAEILLLIEGQAEESIDGKWVPAGVGDIIFLQSQVPHAIRNTGKGPATYFAFQFE